MRFIKNSVKKNKYKLDKLRDLIHRENSENDTIKNTSRQSNFRGHKNSLNLKDASTRDLSRLGGIYEHKTPKVAKQKQDRLSSFPKEGNSFVMNNRVFKKYNIISRKHESSPIHIEEVGPLKYQTPSKKLPNCNYFPSPSDNSFESLPKLSKVAHNSPPVHNSFKNKKSVKIR